MECVDWNGLGFLYWYAFAWYGTCGSANDVRKVTFGVVFDNDLRAGNCWFLRATPARAHHLRGCFWWGGLEGPKYPRLGGGPAKHTRASTPITKI